MCEPVYDNNQKRVHPDVLLRTAVHLLNDMAESLVDRLSTELQGCCELIIIVVKLFIQQPELLDRLNLGKVPIRLVHPGRSPSPSEFQTRFTPLQGYTLSTLPRSDKCPRHNVTIDLIKYWTSVTIVLRNTRSV